MKKTSFLFTITAFLFSTHLFAQEVAVKKDTSYWKKTKQFGLNINEGGVNNNYSAGGQNSIGINSFFNAKAEYAKLKITWVNDFQAQYGTINTFGAGGTGTRKGIDRIFFDSKVGRKLSKTWSVVGGFNFQTQFDNGYKYGGKADGGNLLISNFFAPAFMTEYIGLEWKPKPYFNVVFAPATLRQTIVMDDAVYKDAKGVILPEKYGVAFGKNVQNDLGIIQIVASYDKDVAKNVNLKARYYMFLNANRIEHIDNRLDIKMAAKINKYFSATADLIVLYFDNQSTEIQTAHNLGLGILYTF